MPKQEELDPIVVAALIEDEGEDEKDKEARAKALKEAGDEGEDSDDDPKDDSDDDSEDSDDDKKKPKDAEPEVKKPEDPKDDDPKDDPKDDKSKDDKPKDDSPEDLTDAEKADADKATRKQRREERRQAFMNSLKAKPAPVNPRAELLKTDPNYRPLDYEAQDEFKAEILKADRDKAMQNSLARGAEIERNIQNQERFWDKMEMEDQILRYNPELQFMNPDNKEAYDPKRASVIDNMFFNLIGYKEEPLFDPTTRMPLMDNEGKQQVRATVQRTDLSYKEFVEGYVATMEDWADEEAAERSSEMVKQRSTQGIRPGGSSKRGGKPALRPGVFKNMSDEDFEKYDRDTDEELLSAF